MKGALSRLRAASFRIAIVVLGLLLGFLVAELVVRIVVPSDVAEMRLPGANFERPRDIAEIPFLFRAGVPGWTNNQGLRQTRDVSAQKSPGVFRLLVVGDSVTALAIDGTSPDLLYPSVLEALLKARLSQPLEVLNLSCPGLSMRQELVLLRARGLSLDPDLILIAYVQNDPVRTTIAGAANVDVVRWSKALQLIQLQLARRDQWPSSAWYTSGNAIFERLEGTFAELARLAAKHPVVLVPLPVRSVNSAEQFHLDAVVQLCRRYGIRCLDIYEPLFPYLAAVPQEHPRDLLHFDSAGHRALAEALVEPVIELMARSETERGAIRQPRPDE